MTKARSAHTWAGRCGPSTTPAAPRYPVLGASGRRFASSPKIRRKQHRSERRRSRWFGMEPIVTTQVPVSKRVHLEKRRKCRRPPAKRAFWHSSAFGVIVCHVGRLTAFIRAPALIASARVRVFFELVYHPPGTRRPSVNRGRSAGWFRGG